VVYFVYYFDRTRRDGDDLKALQTSIKTMLVGGTNAPRDDEIRQLFKQWMGTAVDAVQHARKQSNVDQERVALVGFSLGGYIAMSTAATEPNLGVSAVVEFFGGLPRELYAKLDKMPPVMIFHGDKDSVVPLKEATDLKTALQAKKLHVEEKIYPGVDHMFFGDNNQFRWDVAMNAETVTLAFLERQFARKKK